LQREEGIMPEWEDFDCFILFYQIFCRYLLFRLNIICWWQGNSLRSADGWERLRFYAWYISEGILCKCFIIPLFIIILLILISDVLMQEYRSLPLPKIYSITLSSFSSLLNWVIIDGHIIRLYNFWVALSGPSFRRNLKNFVEI